MEVGYDKAALQEYMDEVETLGENMRRHQDESLNLYNSCRQQYNRIHTKLEEVVRRAYNQVENAESMRRSAELEYETARRTAENTEDEDEKNEKDHHFCAVFMFACFAATAHAVCQRGGDILSV